MYNIVNVKNFETSRVVITAPKVKQSKNNTSGQKSKGNNFYSEIIYDGMKNCYFRFPPMENNFPPNQYNSNNDSNITEAASLKLSHRHKVYCDQEKTEEAKEILDYVFAQMREMDEKMVVDFGQRHSKIIMGKDYRAEKYKDVVEALYTKIVKSSSDANGNPYPDGLSFKIKPKYGTSRPDISIFKNDSRSNLNDSPDFTFEQLAELVPRKSMNEVIAKPIIWFVGNKFGITWKAIQLKVSSNSIPKGPPQSYAFSDDEDDQEVREKVDDDDEEDDDDENDDEEFDDDDEEEEVVVST